MKNAYFIAAHHKPYQFEWVYSTIPRDALKIVHVDRKSSEIIYDDIKRVASSRGDVTFMPRRAVSWSGWTQVETEIRAIKVALQDPDWKYFIYLSGQCYPAMSSGEIESMLADAWPNNFIRCWSFDKIRELEPDDYHLRRPAYIDFAGKIRKMPFRLPKSSLDVDYKGSTWHALTRDFCTWIVESDVPKKLARYFKYCLCPDELFFQAAIMNSPFREQRMSDAARYFVFPGPKTMRLEDLEDIVASNAMYARKFDAAVDCEILETLAGKLGYPIPARERAISQIDDPRWTEHKHGRDAVMSW